MPGRALWAGTISFGMVAIPVEIVSAIRPSRVPLHFLHKKDNARLQRKMFCPADNTFVHPEHIVRGYEIEPDNYVVVADQELRSLEPVRSQTIEIQEFVDLGAIDPLLYDRPYYLQSRKGGDKPYVLLATALEETKKAGIAKFVMHSREYLVALTTIESALVLLTLHYQNDLVDPSEFVADTEPDNDIVESITKTIRQSHESFDPAKYIDDQKEKIIEHIHQKQKDRQLVEAPEEAEEEQEAESSGDLIAALEQSLKRVREKEK